MKAKTAKPYINVIATNKKDQNRSELKKLVSIYQSEETANFITKKRIKATISLHLLV
ncbi:hypothetical protein GCM10020331_100160 [Ectobacillus funiculus]